LPTPRLWAIVSLAAVRRPSPRLLETASQGETMIAQVHTSTGPAGPMSDELRKFAEEALSEARTHDGVEGNFFIADPATGESMAIALFRDQAALDAFQSFSKEKIAAAEAVEGGQVGPGRVYSEVIAVL
jgi:hypothetical protein